MMRRPLPLIFTALSIAWGSVVSGQQNAQTIAPLVSFFESGVLCASDTGVTREAPDTVAGTTHVIEHAPPFVSNNHIVPAVIGIGFGVKSGIDAPVALNDVLISVTHPPFAGSGTTQQSYSSYIGPGTDPSINFYQFDYGYELALGEWTMSASFDGYTLWETSFVVVAPADLPELASVCGYQDLIG